jgi:hypothetical protein
MIAIETHYLGPTDYRGARIVASTCNGHRLVQSYDHGSATPHYNAARALADREGWTEQLIGGSTKRGYAWIRVTQQSAA